VVEDITSYELNEFLADVRNRYTLRLSIVKIVEAATSIGLHILHEYFNEGAEGYVGEGMIRLVRLRNLIIHRY